MLSGHDAAVWRCGLGTFHKWAQLGHGDEERDGNLAQELEHLEWQVGRAELGGDQERVDQFAQSRRKLRSCHHVELDGEQSSHDQVAPEFARLHLAENAEEDECCAGTDVVDADALHTMEDVVADGLCLTPLQDLRAEAVVSEAFGWVDQCVSGELEAHVDGFDG